MIIRFMHRGMKSSRKYNSIDDGRAASRVLHLMKQLIQANE